MMVRLVKKDFSYSEKIYFDRFEDFIENPLLKEFEYFISEKNCLIPTELVHKNKELLKLLFTKKIDIHYQPIFSNKTGFIYGFEALLRVNNGDIQYPPKIVFDLVKSISMEAYLDNLCKETAMIKFKQPNLKLFININPNFLKSELYKKGSTLKLALENGLNPKNIVLEITESEKIQDLNALEDAIKYYTSLGFSIAFDDFGTGYSSLELLSKVQPHYIKIPMELVNGVSRSKLKWQIIRGVLDMAVKNGIKTIAEGIENKDDLEAIISLNVDFSQGFLLGKPSNSQEIPKEGIMILRTSINNIKLNSVKDRYKIDIADLESVEIYDKDNVKELFDIIKHNKLKWIYLSKYNTLIEENCIKKVLDIFQENLFYYKDIDYLLEKLDCHYKNLQSIDIQDNLLHIYYIISDKNENVFIVKNKDKIIGVLRKETVLQKLFDIFYKMTLYTNPLTGLPGNVLIEKEIEDILEQKIDAYVVYIDISNFKPFNDAYGFLAGDMMIKKLAETLQIFSSSYDSFVGHIGGDDFVVIFKNLKNPEETINKLYYTISEILKEFYTEEDIKRGYFISKDREGNTKQFPIAKVSLAAINTINYSSSQDISRKAAELKKESKKTIKPIIETSKVKISIL